MNRSEGFSKWTENCFLVPSRSLNSYSIVKTLSSIRLNSGTINRNGFEANQIFRSGIRRSKIELSPPFFHGKLCALMQQVNLGMIGGGTVGSGVFHAWQKNGGLMAARLGVELVLRKIAVKAFDEPRPYPIAD